MEVNYERGIFRTCVIEMQQNVAHVRHGVCFCNTVLPFLRQNPKQTFVSKS